MKILPEKREKKYEKNSREFENNDAGASKNIEVDNLGGSKIEANEGLEKEGVAEMEETEMVKKKNKAKNYGKEDKKKATNDDQAFRMHGKDHNPDAIDKVEERKTKKEKNLKAGKQRPETERIPGVESGKEVEKGTKSGKQGFEKDGIAEMEQDKETVKKKNKAKKDAKVEKKKVGNEDQVIRMSSEDHSPDAIEKVERRRKTEKSLKGDKQIPETKNFPVMQSGEEVDKGAKSGQHGFEKDGIVEMEQEQETVKKKNKAKKDAEGEKKKVGNEDQVIRTSSEDHTPDAIEKVERRRKTEKSLKGDKQIPETKNFPVMQSGEEVDKGTKSGQQGCEKEEIAEIERDRETVTKKNKSKMDAKVEKEKGTNEDEVFTMSNEDHNPDAIQKVKKRKTEKNLKADKQSPETGNIAEKMSGKEVDEGTKNGKVDFGKDGSMEMEPDTETVKKKNKTKRESKADKKKVTNEDQVFRMCREDRNPDETEKERRRTEKNLKADKQIPETESTTGMKIAEEVDKETKNKKAGKNHKNGYTEKRRKKEREDFGIHSDICEVNDMEKVKRKKRKMEKKQNKGDGNGQQETRSEAYVDSNDDDLTSDKILDNEKKSEKVVKTFNEGQEGVSTDTVEKKKKKVKKNENEKLSVHLDSLAKDTVDAEGSVVDNEIKKKKKRKKEKPTDDCTNQQDNPKLMENGSDSPKTKSHKKVRFSGHNEFFHLPDDSNAVTGNSVEDNLVLDDLVTGNIEGDNLVRGKRFTREEDEIVQAAVYKYIEEHDLGEEGLEMVLNSRKYFKKLRNCWKEIGLAIPYRPNSAVYYRAQILFRRSETRKWTQEQYDILREYQKEHGNKWRPLADEFGKHSWHVKDAWRRIRLPNLKHGHWSQEEYQGLFDLVNADLRRRVHEEKKSMYGMLRDNICWTAISDKLATREQASCCNKWYGQLTSPLVAEGKWADVDDYRLLIALDILDATCKEDVDWDNLLDDRSGGVCFERWNQMVLHIGDHGNKSFAEQVEVLAKRYCPELLEAREAWDSKPRVP